MRSSKDLIKIWTAALEPVCNHSTSHANQEVKWLLLHAKEITRQRVQRAKPNFNSRQTRHGHGAGQLSEQVVGVMQHYVDQRVKDRKPLQYILGKETVEAADQATLS